ncbi:MAG: F0F1 ATP synthase subunit B [Sphingomonadaceae bacterium]|nr:F0F1 ATP synthase subunit B [Sphingomonadaceae bacterium]
MFTAPAYAQGTEAGPDAEAPDAPETHSEVGVEHDAGGSFPPFDSSTFPSQLLWLAITFGLFYLFLKKVILPRIGGILEVRQDRIAQDIGEAARLKEEADAAVAAYEQELADARTKANAIGQEARDGAKAKAEAERKKVEGALETKLAEAEARIALIKDAAMRDVGQIAEETAGSIVRELVGSDADKTAVAAAVKSARG